MSSKTGNIAVEYFNTRKNSPSGILATTSDFWFVVLKPLEAWVCLTSSLRDYFHRATPLRVISCGGDNNSAMKLYKKDSILVDIFHRVDTMEPSALVELLSNLLTLQVKEKMC
jgi:hypothetical protein